MAASGVSSTVLAVYGAIFVMQQAVLALFIFLRLRDDFYGMLAGWAIGSASMIVLNNIWIGVAAKVVA